MSKFRRIHYPMRPHCRVFKGVAYEFPGGKSGSIGTHTNRHTPIYLGMQAVAAAVGVDQRELHATISSASFFLPIGCNLRLSTPITMRVPKLQSQAGKAAIAIWGHDKNAS